MAQASYRYTNSVGAKWAQLKTFLRNLLESASFQIIWKFMAHSTDFTDRAFTGLNWTSAFRDTGVNPLSYKQIMSENNFYRDLSRLEKKIVHGKIPPLATEFAENDFIRAYTRETR